MSDGPRRRQKMAADALRRRPKKITEDSLFYAPHRRTPKSPVLSPPNLRTGD